MFCGKLLNLSVLLYGLFKGLCFYNNIFGITQNSVFVPTPVERIKVFGFIKRKIEKKKAKEEIKKIRQKFIDVLISEITNLDCCILNIPKKEHLNAHRLDLQNTKKAQEILRVMDCIYHCCPHLQDQVDSCEGTNENKLNTAVKFREDAESTEKVEMREPGPRNNDVDPDENGQQSRDDASTEAEDENGSLLRGLMEIFDKKMGTFKKGLRLACDEKKSSHEFALNVTSGAVLHAEEPDVNFDESVMEGENKIREAAIGEWERLCRKEASTDETRQELLQLREALGKEKEDFAKEKDSFYREKQDFRKEQEAFNQQKLDFVEMKESFLNEKLDFLMAKEELNKKRELFDRQTQEFGRLMEFLDSEKEAPTEENDASIKEKDVPIKEKEEETLSNATEENKVQKEIMLQSIADMKKRDGKGNVHVTTVNGWKVYLNKDVLTLDDKPYMDLLPVTKMKTKPVFQEQPQAVVSSTSMIKAKINNNFRGIGLATCEMSCYSIMTLDAAVDLGLDKSIRELTPSAVEGQIFGDLAVIGIIENVEVILDDKIGVVVDFYVQNRYMYPNISLGREVLWRYGFVRQFDADGSKLFIKNDENKAGNLKYPGFPLTFNVYLEPSGGKEAIVHLREGERNLVRSQFLKKKKNVDYPVPAMGTVGPFVDSLLISTKHGTTIPVKMAVTDNIPQGNGDIFLGTNFLSRVNAIVDYSQKFMYVKIKRKYWYRFNLGE